MFALFAVAAIVTAAVGWLRDRTAMLSGLGLLPPGLVLLVAAQLLQSLPLLVAAACVAGTAAALGYRGSLEIVNRIAPGNRRSEVVSAYLIAVYLGNSLPVIGIGLLATLIGAGAAHIVFAVVIALLAGFALIAGARRASG